MHHHHCCGNEMGHGSYGYSGHDTSHGGSDCHDHYNFIIPREEVVDPGKPSREFFIGGSGATDTVLEYMPLTGATSPALTITMTAPGGEVKKWSPDPFPTAYDVKSDFKDPAAGTRVVLEIKETIARMRWFETVHYHHK